MINNLFILNILNSVRVYLADHLNDDTEDKDRKFIETMLLSIDRAITTIRRREVELKDQ